MSFNEKELMKKLGIESWNELESEDKFFQYIMYADTIDKKLQYKIIEQIPNYVDLAKQVTDGVYKLAEQKKEISEKYLNIIEGISNGLGSLLQKDDLSFEQKKYVIDNMMKLADIINKMEERDVNFWQKALNILGWIGGGLLLLLLYNNKDRS